MRAVAPKPKPKLKISMCAHSPAIMVYWPGGRTEYKRADTTVQALQISWFVLKTVFQNKYDLTIEE